MADLSTSASKASQYNVKVNRLQDLSEMDLSRWVNLETSALEPNAFLSPHFILPAVRYLEKTSSIFLLTVHKNSGGTSNLVGIFPFKVSKFSRYLPLPHLSAFHSRHSYKSGILVDQDHAETVLELIYNYICKHYSNYAGLVFEERSAEGRFYEIEKSTAQQAKLKWIPFTHWDRSILFPDRLEEAHSLLPKRVLKNYRRGTRGLSEVGRLNWEIIAEGKIGPKNINDFIRLENLGWKGENKSSLFSNPDYARFFQEMIENFNKEGRAFFTELQINSETIASTSNIISGNAGFAFKIGWDPSYSKHSPGILNEISLLESKGGSFSKLEYIDSGTSADSTYIDAIWPGKKRMETGAYIHSKVEKIIGPALRLAVYPGLDFAKKTRQKISQH